MRATLIPDRSFFGVLEFNAAQREQGQRGLGLFVRRGVGRRIGLPPRQGVQTRALDALGFIRPPARPGRVTQRLDEQRQDVAHALRVARAAAVQDLALGALDQQADRLVGNLAEADLRLAALHARSDMGAGEVTEVARQVLAGHAQDVRAWTLRAEQVERSAVSGVVWERRGRGHAPVVGASSSGSALSPARSALSAGGGAVARDAAARLSRMVGAVPGVQQQTVSPRVRLNRLAARPSVGAVVARVDAMEAILHEAGRTVVRHERRRQQRHQMEAPVLKPRSRFPETQKETSH